MRKPKISTMLGSIAVVGYVVAILLGQHFGPVRWWPMTLLCLLGIFGLYCLMALALTMAMDENCTNKTKSR